MGGGNDPMFQQRPIAAGLSPRGRGKHFHRGVEIAGTGSIPAWAGETPPAMITSVAIRVYPRVGGGNSPLCGKSGK